MPATILQPPVEGDLPPRKRFTRAEVEQMLEAGLFAGERFELIEGDLIEKMGQNPPHASGIQLVFSWLVKILRPERVRVQLPIEVSAADRESSWPEPDVAVLGENKPDYRRRHPRGEELILVVEVADTTVQHDATTKRDLYARAGVPEYWVLDIGGRQLIVHRGAAQGRYERVQVLTERDTAALEAHPDVSIPVAEILP
jgi:Uma2 family endonuclease